VWCYRSTTVKVDLSADNLDIIKGQHAVLLMINCVHYAPDEIHFGALSTLSCDAGTWAGKTIFSNQQSAISNQQSTINNVITY